MSVTHAGRDQRAGQQSRRKRKPADKAAEPRPEPKLTVGGAGQQLDPSVRRELEERLGHDLGRVRLHTDRDAAALTGLLGADAVTVGQHVFLAEGAFQPGTTAGRRLLAHELLHTIQAPHGLGTLTEGRDDGAVSLPDQAAEREAEEAAEQAVTERLEQGQIPDAPEAADAVAEREQTPGWMRYATVNANRFRSDRLDPATVPDRLAAQAVRSLRGDPADASGRVRMQLARLAPDLRASVLGRLRTRLFSSEYDRVLDLASAAAIQPFGFQPAETPAVVPDAGTQAADDYEARINELKADATTRAQQAKDAGTEKRDVKERDATQARQLSQAQQDAATEGADLAQRTQQEDTRAVDEQQDAAAQQQQDDKEGADRRDADQQDAQRAEQQKDDGDRTTQARKEQREREEADPEQATEPGAPKKDQQDEKQRPPTGQQPQPTDPKKAEEPGLVRAEKVDERADERDSPLVRHGLTEKDEDEGEPREEEQPIGAEAGADANISEAEAGASQGGKIRGEAEITPDDYLPDTDLDVSAVPTAEQIQVGAGGATQPAIPAFPAPPPTKAEQLEVQRERNADADEDDAPEADAKAPGEEQGPVAGEAPKPEGGPAAEAIDRTDRDLQPDKPTDQEVGPDPQAQDRPEAQQQPEQRKDPQSQQDLDADGSQKDRRQERDTAADRDDSGDGTGTPDAQSPQDEQADRKDADTHQEQRDAKGQPEGDAADKPSGAKPSGIAGESDSAADTAAAKSAKPSGAHTEPAPTPDRTPSPAAKRVSEQVKPDNEAAGPKSAIRNENSQDGDPAAPDSQVGGSEPVNAQSSVAGPGGAAPANSTAVSPASEQTADSRAQRTGTAQPAQNASLEKDGGGCAPPEQAPEPEGQKCSANGGGKAPATKEKQPPDVSQQEPTTALATVSKLRPDQADQALPGVSRAASNSVDKKRKNLQAKPPARERPSGAPQTQAKPPPSQPAERQVTGRVERVGVDPENKKQEAQGGTHAQGAQPAANVATPAVTGNKNGQVDASDVQKMQAAANDIPTTDPELDNKTVGPAPKIRLEGASDPSRTDKQVTKLKDKQTDLQDTGRADASKNLGEDHIYPNAPKELLKGTVNSAPPAGSTAKAGPPAQPGYGTVAQQERGPQINAGAAQAQTQMASAQKKQQQGEQQTKSEGQRKIDAEVQRNADQQTKERGKAADDAKVQRTQWRDAQDAKIRDANDKSGNQHTDSNKAIVKHRDDNDKKLADRKTSDDKQIVSERTKAEKDAKKKKDQGQHHSFLGGLVSKVGNFFKGLLKDVTDIFNAARKLVNDVIDKFKKWADDIIDSVRNFVVSAINKLADALIALGDVLLAAFPSLRDKFRKAIEDLRDKAIAKVNQWANELKAAVNKLLDWIGEALNGLLKVLEAGLKDAISKLQNAITSALKFVEKAVAVFGEFKQLIADIAPDPGGWISKAVTAMKTGITDYLWGAIKTAVKAWFNEKVQSVLGLAKMIIDILVKGCMSLKQIGQMAWNAIIASLPMMIIMLVIEKVVSMIIPAAGAILTIIQGLIAAWGTVSRILAAFGAFFNFLKAVKAGPAACLFAEFVAASVVALLEFIANFLLMRLGRALKPVGARLKVLAQKIMNGLKKVAKGARKVAGRVVNSARGAVRKATQAMRKPEHEGKPKTAHVPSRPKASADHTRPGGPKHPPSRVDHDRPPSRVPDRAKEHRREQSEAKQANDREKANATSPHHRPEDRTPDVHRPEAGKPGEHTPKEHEPREHEPREHEPEKPKKPKETEAPKRDKPREPKSRAGRVLSKVKNAVKGALKKVGNGLKALGRKLRKSKTGKALENAGKKFRNFFKKKRDTLRDNRHRRKEQKNKKRDDRKKKEGKDSKDVRLQKITARIRPKIGALLGHGVRGVILRSALMASRLWYRLTSLDLSGSKAFRILARLNPQAEVADGLSVDEDELLDFLNILSKEILNYEKVKSGRSSIGQMPPPYHPGNLKDQPASVRRQWQNQERFGIPKGVGLASVFSFLAKRKFRGTNTHDLLEFLDDEGPAQGQVRGSISPSAAVYQPNETDAISANIEKRITESAENASDPAEAETKRRTQEAIEDQRRAQRRTVKGLNRKATKKGLDRSTRAAALSYDDILRKIFSDDARGDDAMNATRELARGERPTGRRGDDAAELGVLIAGQEAHRNPRTLITSGMILDIAGEGDHVELPPGKDPSDPRNLTVDRKRRMAGADALRLLPMTPQGAMEQARQLDEHLNRPKEERELEKRSGAQALADREIMAIRVWIKSLDIKTSEGGKIETLDALKAQIRQRMYRIYGL